MHLHLDLRHRSRRLTPFIVAVALLFAQLAWASYVCPATATADTMVGGMAARMAAGAPCAGMDEAQPALCHQHAHDPAQPLESAKPPVVLAAALLQTAQAGCQPVDDAVPTPLAWARCEPRPPPDPVFLTTRRLRV
jgi:hypothetical protein